MSSETSTGPTAIPAGTAFAALTEAGDETTVCTATEETVFATPTVPVTYADQPRVAGFVAAHRLGGYVDAAVRLARKCFAGSKGITLEMFGEPGACGERLFVEVATGAGVDESLPRYHDFVKRWVAATPPWVTDLMGISTDLR